MRKLYKAKKIEIVEPSKAISQSYLLKSEKSLSSARILIKTQDYDNAVALTYYSMYYATLALFYLCGIKSENHMGTIILLKEVFGIDNSELEKAKRERIDKQYYTDFTAKFESVIDGIHAAEPFNAIIMEKIDRIKESEIKEYNKKAIIVLTKRDS